ncbi:hypothetical protein [Sphingomonas sp. IW22]|uniref:hypothetical protein n=1 Tax=Sphingomonas sp. IW22 TaxID=3242489 RepID=UPI0035210E4F
MDELFGARLCAGSPRRVGRIIRRCGNAPQSQPISLVLRDPEICHSFIQLRRAASAADLTDHQVGFSGLVLDGNEAAIDQHLLAPR